MHPLLDKQAEEQYDAILEELEAAGYKWDGALCIAPDGHRFAGIIDLPFYMQVYKVHMYHTWRKSQDTEYSEHARYATQVEE